MSLHFGFSKTLAEKLCYVSKVIQKRRWSLILYVQWDWYQIGYYKFITKRLCGYVVYFFFSLSCFIPFVRSFFNFCLALTFFFLYCVLALMFLRNVIIYVSVRCISHSSRKMFSVMLFYGHDTRIVISIFLFTLNSCICAIRCCRWIYMRAQRLFF